MGKVKASTKGTKVQGVRATGGRVRSRRTVKRSAGKEKVSVFNANADVIVGNVNEDRPDPELEAKWVSEFQAIVDRFDADMSRFCRSFRPSKTTRAGVNYKGDHEAGLRIVPLSVLGYKSREDEVQNFHGHKANANNSVTPPQFHVSRLNGVGPTLYVTDFDQEGGKTQCEAGTLNGLAVVREVPSFGGGLDWVGDPAVAMALETLKVLYYRVETAIESMLRC